MDHDTVSDTPADTNPRERGPRDALIRLLQRHPIAMIGLLLFVGMAAILVHLERFSMKIKESVSLESADVYARTLGEFRTFYAEELLPRVKLNGVPVTHDYLRDPRALPIPATMSIDLSKRLSATEQGYGIRVFSDYPFPWRVKEGGPRDDYERAALYELRRTGTKAFSRFEEMNGVLSLRYASPMLMEKACVSCHNTHPDSPKKDWKVGDVRGVQEITIPLEKQLGEIKSGLLESFLIMMTITLLGLGVLWVAIGGMRRSLAQTQDLAEKQRVINEELQVQIAERTRAEMQLEETNRTLETKVDERTRELSDKNAELSSTLETLQTTLDKLKAAQDQLIVQEKLASLGELTAAISHEIKNPLNFVTNFAKLARKLTAEVRDILSQSETQFTPATVDDLRDINNDIDENLEKINEHGQRADSIIRGMLMHSRGISEELMPTDVNALLKEYVDLSYHGMRAQMQDFNVSLHASYEEGLPLILIAPQDVSRVFLNILKNGMYATHQKRLWLGEEYAPDVSVSTKRYDDDIEIRIRDNGPGIPDELREKIFEPFFTTKPAGEGTGLGLSLSYEVIKRHFGTIRVESAIGEFTEFIIRLPIRTQLSPAPAEDETHTK
ncbi:MAG: DUF3365 domain-containing protein [Ignavibacteriae bacterium]|nr:DUF3365 domain-containing protein [Ignavibacteriota bacterium]